MEIRSILVNVDPDNVDSPALRYAFDLASSFDAEVVGIGADEPSISTWAFDEGGTAYDFYEIDRREIEKRLLAAGQLFQDLVPANLTAHWRGHVFDPIGSLVEAAAIADIIVTGPTTVSTARGAGRVNVGELVLGSGRPVIDVGDGAHCAKVETVVIGWKDTREARRAVADSAPFLKRARNVTAITIGEGNRRTEQESLDELVLWLRHHGVAANGEVVARDQSTVDPLAEAAMLRGADLLVTGCYGHSRARQWLFGGVTRKLLAANALNRFFAH